MAANKVVFGNKVLIDLTGDTVTEEALLKGYTAHKADGTIITGTAFAGYPNEFVFLDKNRLLFRILYNFNPASYSKPDRSYPALKMAIPGDCDNRSAGAIIQFI